MAATTRWVEYSVAAPTSTYLGATTSGVGTRGYIKAKSIVGDSFTIGSTNNKLQISVDGESHEEITLTSGIDLDARFVARDITEKMHSMVGIPANSWDHATCEWINNQLNIYSGNIGAGASIAVVSGTATAYGTLGFASNDPVPGSGHSHKSGGNWYNGGITTSGTWEGMFDEVYTIIINKELTIGTPSHSGNTYIGTMTPGGQYNHGSADSTYTITINTAVGATVGGGTGGVPTFGWTGTNGDNSAANVEILYADHWYNVGVYGLKVKWTDSVFGSGDSWTILCTRPTKAVGNDGTALPGTALYSWTSTRGDECTGVLETSDTVTTRVGTRGLYMKFGGGSNHLEAGDEFRITCTPPQPTTYDISNLNYGNVTVTTESAIKCVVFEIMGGAIMMTSVKFGLQNHGSFNYHPSGDTEFRFGTVGGENKAGTGTTAGKEWRTGVTADDLSGTLPTYLFANKANLLEVSTADDSEPIGNYQGGLVSDFMYVGIRLGSDETGSNSSVNYRLYFDYS